MTARRIALSLLMGVVLLMMGYSPMWAQEVQEGAAKEKKASKAFECPYSHISDQDKCFDCHGRGKAFKQIRETDPDDLRDYPNAYIRIQDKVGQFFMAGEITFMLTGKNLKEAMDYLERNGIRNLEIEIQSGGGAVFEGWRVKALIDEWQMRGNKARTIVRSFAGSAAFLIFCAADTRLASPTAEFMTHELWTFKFLDISSPADKEDEARILRHLQDGMSAWIASRTNGKISKDELDKKIRKKEWWFNGKEAVDFGFSTGFIK